MSNETDFWYHLGYADGEGSMENITPMSEKWHSIEEMGFDRAKSRVLALHRPVVNVVSPTNRRICEHDSWSWPCPTALIFLPELDDTPLPNLRPDLDSPW
jgi:hypothetical protein